MSLHNNPSQVLLAEPARVPLTQHSCAVSTSATVKIQVDDELILSTDPAMTVSDDEEDSVSSPIDLSECDPSFEEENTEEASELSGQSKPEPDNVEAQEEDNALAYFQELTELRSRRKRGVLIVRCHRESKNASVYKSIMADYRERRSQRLKQNGQVCQHQAPRVQFGDLTIHEFPMILGDNPGCYTGPPLAISWKPQDTMTLSVEEFESTRPPRRCHAEMILPASMREQLLRRAGYGRNEIIELTKPVNIARRQRKRTKETQNLDKLSFVCERLLRATRHTVTLGYKKRQERKFLEPFVQDPVFSSSSNKKGDLSNSISSTVALDISEDMT